MAGERRCPTCGAVHAADDVFCEADGTRLDGLVARAPISPVVSPMRSPSPGACDGCGAADADDGDGFCNQCGHRLKIDTTKRVDASIYGDTLASVVTNDAHFPAWNPPTSIDELLAALPRLVDLVATIAAAKVPWSPCVGDIVVRDDGSLAIASLRIDTASALGVLPLRILATLCGAAIPEPAVRTSPVIVRALLGAVAPPDLAEVRAAVASLTSAPHADDARIAAASDVGLRHVHNEDAVLIAAGTSGADPWSLLVVCDGVSSGAHANEASAIAAKTASDTITYFAGTPDLAFESIAGAVDASIRAAHLAVCGSFADVAARELPDRLPGTTIVLAFVFRNRATIGWVGDSRAYWLGAHGAELLTTDDSWAAESVARGELSEEDAMRAPLAHALTRCLGPLEVGPTPAEIEVHVRARDLAGDGLLLLCTDGLWNDFASPAAMHALVESAGRSATLDEIARFAVSSAILSGGHDNITVALHRHGKP